MGKNSKEIAIDTKPSATPAVPTVAYLSPIATPLANEKLSKKIFKVVKKATKQKNARRGVKEVVKALRKGSQGLVVLAGDTMPVDVLSHLPVLCEDKNVPYIFISSKVELGASAHTKRPTCTVMVLTGQASESEADYKEDLDTVITSVKALH
ncbi:snoRNA-binding protein [Dimargaris cristalligena]|nr:snoRNA-binding protein [Dimargaris cristalligena]